jgi:hypothetical protein
VVWAVGGIVGLLVSYVVFRSRKYGRIFSDAHVIEIGRAVASLKTAALANDDTKPSSPGDPHSHTSAYLAIVYTVRKDDTGYVHSCSVSVRNGYTAHAVGRTFVAFAAKLLGLPLDRMAFVVTPSTVHYGEVTLDSEEHAALAAAPVLEVSASNARELVRAAMDMQLAWKRIGAP